jgi:hypothetical protein
VQGDLRHGSCLRCTRCGVPCVFRESRRGQRHTARDVVRLGPALRALLRAAPPGGVANQSDASSALALSPEEPRTEAAFAGMQATATIAAFPQTITAAAVVHMQATAFVASHPNAFVPVAAHQTQPPMPSCAARDQCLPADEDRLLLDHLLEMVRPETAPSEWAALLSMPPSPPETPYNKQGAGHSRARLVTGIVADMLHTTRARIQIAAESDLVRYLQSPAVAVVVAVLGAILVHQSSLVALPIIRGSMLCFALVIALRFLSARLAARCFCVAVVGVLAYIAVGNMAKSPEELNELVGSIHWSAAAPAVAFGGSLFGLFPAAIITLKERALFLALAVSLRLVCMLSNYLRTGNTTFLYLPMVLLPTAVTSFGMTVLVVQRYAREALPLVCKAPLPTATSDTSRAVDAHGDALSQNRAVGIQGA